MKKKLKEAEKVVDKAEQDGYKVGVVEIEEAFRVEVLEVRRIYCHQVRNKALNQARVEASSALRRAESVYYPFAIQASSSLGSKADTAFKEENIGEDSPTKALPPSDSLLKEASSLGLLRMKKTQQREWLLIPPSLQLHPKTPLRRKRLPTIWRL